MKGGSYNSELPCSLHESYTPMESPKVNAFQLRVNALSVSVHPHVNSSVARVIKFGEGQRQFEQGKIGGPHPFECQKMPFSKKTFAIKGGGGGVGICHSCPQAIYAFY